MAKTAQKPRVAVALSGGGRSLENLLQKQNSFLYQVGAVISSSKTCGGVQIAQKAGLPIFIGDFSSAGAKATGEAMYSWLASQKIDWLALAGFLKPLPIFKAWEGRIINIHPALLPSFGGKGMFGLNVHKAVLSKREKQSGATIHLVSERYDEGRILAQVKVAVRPEDTPEILAARVFAAECNLYPQVLNDLVTEKIRVNTGAVKIYEF